MRKVVSLVFILSVLVAGCEMFGEGVDPSPSPEPGQPPTESCSDNLEHALLENMEASVIEIELACLIKNHPEQQRDTMSYHPVLGEVARMRARDMAEFGYFGHVDLDGRGPDWHICERDYKIFFDGYCESVFTKRPETNSVENLSYSRRPPTMPFHPEEAVSGWYTSPIGHKEHLLGTSLSNCPDQCYYGAGYVRHEEGEYVFHYWVSIISVPPISEIE